jgi:hypothetical protein
MTKLTFDYDIGMAPFVSVWSNSEVILSICLHIIYYIDIRITKYYIGMNWVKISLVGGELLSSSYSAWRLLAFAFDN